MHTFSQGCLPRLLYATIQTAGPAVNRTIHRHEGCTELLYVFAGEGVYTAGGHSYPIGAGDVLLYNQGDLHEVISSSSREICDYCFGIAGLTFEGLPTGHLCAAGEAFVRPAGGRNAELASLSRLLYQTTEENTPISREIAGHLLPALILLAAGLPADERSQTQDKNIVLAHRMRQYIGQHFQNPLTLEEIGAVFGISPYHAAHIFKEVVGVSPIQYHDSLPHWRGAESAHCQRLQRDPNRRHGRLCQRAAFQRDLHQDCRPAAHPLPQTLSRKHAGQAHAVMFTKNSCPCAGNRV